MPDMKATSRRRFLKTAAAAGTLTALPYFIPASALGKNGATPPSERISLAASASRIAACTI